MENPSNITTLDSNIKKQENKEVTNQNLTKISVDKQVKHEKHEVLENIKSVQNSVEASLIKDFEEIVRESGVITESETAKQGLGSTKF